MKIEHGIDDISQKKREQAKELHFFDANIWMGEPDFFPVASELPVHDLEAVCCKYHLHGGLVSH